MTHYKCAVCDDVEPTREEAEQHVQLRHADGLLDVLVQVVDDDG